MQKVTDMKTPITITAKDVMKLLASKHSEDVFIPECKTGATQVGNHQRFDAWVMPRSWVNHTTIGYEVKVSRSDFMNDDKWYGYLPYCNEFNFVAPPGIIDPSEVPDDVGLYITSKNCTRLFRKRKAVRRDIDINSAIWIYILMARSAVISEYQRTTINQGAFWAEWLKRKADFHEIGWRVSKRISREHKENIQAVVYENERLKGMISGLEEVKKFCDEHNIRPSSHDPTWKLKQMVENAGGGEFLRSVKIMSTTIDNFKESFEKIMGQL